MRYIITQKFWSCDDVYIYDEQRQPIFVVVGPAFTWGSRLSVQDMQGKELGYISQQRRILPRFEIYRAGQLFAQIEKERIWRDKIFTLDVPGPNDYTIDGCFLQHDYQFIRGGRIVARVAEESWSWSDTYGVETVHGEDDVAVLCLAIAIELVLYGRAAP